MTSPSLSRSWNLLTCKVAGRQRKDRAAVCADWCVEDLNTDLAFILECIYTLFIFLYFLFFFFILSLYLSPFILPFHLLILFRFFFIILSSLLILCTLLLSFLNIVLCFPSLRSLFLHFQFIFLFFLLTLPLTHNHFHK